MNENNLMREFILFFANLPEHDFHHYSEYFIHNRVHSEIADIITHYIRLDKSYDFLATKAFLKAIELRALFN
ncbi:hypothetical protein KHQ81_07180 [Mycoplasmatota bacterium]|nr:hypothetical protein KHQ81_07180 [Mycoplasmatota bacterium]